MNYILSSAEPKISHTKIQGENRRGGRVSLRDMSRHHLARKTTPLSDVDRAATVWGSSSRRVTLGGLERFMQSWTQRQQREFGYTGELLNRAFAEADVEGKGWIDAAALQAAANTGPHCLLWKQLVSLATGGGIITSTVHKRKKRRRRPLPRIAGVPTFDPVPPSAKQASLAVLPLTHRARFAMSRFDGDVPHKALSAQGRSVWDGAAGSVFTPHFTRGCGRLDRAFFSYVNSNQRANPDVAAATCKQSREEDGKFLHRVSPKTAVVACDLNSLQDSIRLW